MAVSGSSSANTFRVLHCKTLHEYLKSLSTDVLDGLYNHPATCLAVFRELPELARHFILRNLFVDQPIPKAVVSSWVAVSHIKDFSTATQTLSDLRLWMDAAIPGGLPGWDLNPTFRKHMKTALMGGGQLWLNCMTLEPDKYARDVQFLEGYAMQRWESVLHYLVGCTQQSTEGVSADAVRVLEHAELVRSDEPGGQPVITPSGFQFLLMDTLSQVWYFILQYLDTLEARNLDMVECLCFLFQLGFMTLGQDYSTTGMSKQLLVFLQHLREFGMIYQRKRQSGRFYPTQLAINLTTGISHGAVESAKSGFIVVETNYRVYAYTESNLQIALLGLFTELLYRLPNLSVAIITRDSIRQALKSGITADQIITFLRMHSHPEAQKHTPIIPPTVTDQIRLWEMERDRFSFTEGVLYNQFLSQHDFELLRNYARDLDVLTWDNSAKRLMVVSRAGHDAVKRFWKRQKHN